MFLAVCLATSLILAIALWLCWTRARGRAAQPRARPGAPVDYRPIPGTRMFDAELSAVEPSAERKAVDLDDQN